ATKLPDDRLTVEFVTPTRLVAGGRLLRRPDVRALTLRLVERLEALEQAYGPALGAEGTEGAEGDQAAHARRRERYLAFEREARAVRVARDETRWLEVMSHSARQQRAIPIGGFVGEVTFEGALRGLRELLAWGEIAHAGKNAVKGDGCMRVRAATPDVGGETARADTASEVMEVIGRSSGQHA
ncbi:MAG: CRISPR system precrRNA processing endoribonuclease RAMP protein Cas6, partial [Ktedonobacterales bacterium]